MEYRPANIHHEPHVQPISNLSGSYAFLNHSSVTLPNNLPPDVDDKLLARHKRRRTSPEDQAILEAAFAQDSKPDKTARLELVERVALGEKEVQIWFQNRRQTSRRKSRPLLPHEIAKYQLSRSGWDCLAIPSDSNFGAVYDGSIQPNALVTDGNSKVVLENAEAPQLVGVETADNIRANAETASSLPTPSQASTKTNSTTSGSMASSQSFASNSQSGRESTTPSQPNGPVRSLANRRSAPSLRVGRATDKPEYFSQEAVQTVSGCRLKKSSSVVRLSLSYEGNAQVTTKDGSSPSPPRPPQVLQVSTVGNYNTPQPPKASAHGYSVPPFKPMQRSSSGRSRDSRAWEFWCDKDARSELEDKAEKDASGSAADAIDLLRSTSGRKVLGTLPTKRNSNMSRQSSSTKRARLHTKSSLLHRSSTWSGGLQNKPLNGATSISDPVRKLKHSESAVSVYIPSNDSDKENWSPQSTEHSGASTLNEPVSVDHHISSHAAISTHENDGVFVARESRSSLSNDENDDPEADPELAAFMHSEGKSNSISEEEELDCVQNLLSLSQGNWR